MATTTQLKLLVTEENNKVIFAEAGKDFVTILGSFLTLPLETIVRVVEKETNMGPITVGCLNSLYHSVADLDKQHLLTDTFNDMLKRKNSLADHFKFLLFNKASKELVAQNFIVTDNLIVRPNLSLDQLNQLGVKYTTSVKEMTVNVTEKQVQDLLKCSLLSKSALTDVFLKKGLDLENKNFYPCLNIEKKIDIQIKVKLFLRKTDGEIMFAQGEEDFADFLFSLLIFSLGAVANMLGENSSPGSIYEMYTSIANLDGIQYLISNDVRNKLHEGCVKGPTLFMVTNDLVVQPMSPFAAISLLNRLDTPLTNLIEKVVCIGAKEGLNIYKAALTSRSALTNGLAHLLN